MNSLSVGFAVAFALLGFLTWSAREVSPKSPKKSGARRDELRTWIAMALWLMALANALRVGFDGSDAKLSVLVGLAPFAEIAALVLGARALASVAEDWGNRYSRTRVIVDVTAITGLLLFLLRGRLFSAVEAAESSLHTALVIEALALLLFGACALVMLPRAVPQRRFRASIIGLGVELLLAARFTELLHRLDDVRTAVPLGLLALGVLVSALALNDSSRSMLDRPLPASIERMIIVGPFLVLIFALGLMSVIQLAKNDDVRSLSWVIVALAILVATRQFLSLLENLELNQQLERTVAELRARELDLQHLAFHDPLTALANRALFSDRVGQALARSRRADSRAWVLFIDLDDFKTVNDRFGHAAGDALLQSFADTLRGMFRPTDTVARLGGDEFAILLEGPAGATTGLDAAGRILDRLHQPMRVLYQDLTVHISIGVGVSGGGSDLPRLPSEPPAEASTVLDVESLLRRADVAMHAAKDQGKNRVVGFEPAMHSLVLERLELTADLERDINAGSLEVLYQPIVSLDTGRVVAVEALVRWPHPTKGLIGPNKFVPLAEHANLMVPLGRFVLQEACRQASRWLTGRSEPFQLSVNLSATQLSDPFLLDDVAGALRAADLPPGCLVLEVTEGVLMHHTSANLRTLEALKHLGIILAIDDFGTGYSSLSYLQKFPIDKVKIDKSFLDEVNTSSSTYKGGGSSGSGGDAVILAGIVQLARALGLRVVAEGVENEDQLRRLYELGCDEAQGYLFARPLKARDLTRWLREEGADQVVESPDLIA